MTNKKNTPNYNCLFVDTDSPISAVSIWVDKGSRSDPVGKEGLAHFFEHIFMTQTKTYPTRQKRLQKLESSGIYFNAFTSKEKTFFFHQQPVEKTEKSLRLLLEGFRNAQIKKNTLEKEKKIILQEESRNRENVSEYFWRLRDRVLWPGSTLSKDLYGNANTINSISIKDVVNFKKEFYIRDNISFIIIGQVDKKRIIKIISNYFAPRAKITSPKAAEKMSAVTPLFFEERKINNTYVGIYYKTEKIQDAREVVAVELVREILAGTWISMLNQSLRVRNDVTYWVTGNSSNFSDTGYIGFEFSCIPSRLKFALLTAIKDIDSIKTRMTGKDLLPYINSLAASTLRNNLTPEELLWWYGQMKITNGMDLSPTDYVKILKTITVSEVKNVIEKYLRIEDRSLIVVGPKSAKKIAAALTKRNK